MPRYIENKDDNFYKAPGCTGVIIGTIILIMLFLFGCKERNVDSRPVQWSNGKGLDIYDTTNLESFGMHIYDSAGKELFKGSGRKSDPIRIAGENMQELQLDLLKDIKKEIKKALSPSMKDTAYRHNIMQIGDTMYYSVIKRRKGKVVVYINKQYTDHQYFIHDTGIDTITP